MNIVRTIVAAALLVASMTTAFALPIPFMTQGQPQHRYADKLYGYARIDTDASGKPLLKVEFSNSRKWKGERGVAVVVRLMAGGEAVQTLSVRREIQDPRFKGTRKVHVIRNLEISAEDWGRVTNVEYAWHGFITKDQMKDLEKLPQGGKGPDMLNGLGKAKLFTF
jgi:hypothetical protein